MTTVVNFVCDRLPDQDGCRFIELENDAGESVGDDVGQWRSRADGLVELHVELSQSSLFTAIDMGTAAADGRRSLAEHLIKQIAIEHPDQDTLLTVKHIAQWVALEAGL